MSRGWTHRSCERCFIDHHPNMLPTLMSQTLVFEEGPGKCCFCLEPTVIGIYVRVDPSTVLCTHTKEEGA